MVERASITDDPDYPGLRTLHLQQIVDYKILPGFRDRAVDVVIVHGDGITTFPQAANLPELRIRMGPPALAAPHPS